MSSRWGIPFFRILFINGMKVVEWRKAVTRGLQVYAFNVFSVGLVFHIFVCYLG